MNIEEEVRDIISEKFEIDKSLVNDSTLIEEELRANSLDRVELIIAFEEKFNIVIRDSDAQSIKTVGDATKAISDRIQIKVPEYDLPR